MKKGIAILAVFVLLVLTSCSVLRKQKTQIIYQTRDSIHYIDREVTRWKDTTVFRYIKGKTDSIYIKGKDMPCKLNIKPATVYDDFSRATAWVTDNNLYLKIVQEDTVMAFNLAQAIRETEHWKKEYTSLKSKESQKVETVKKVRSIPWWLYAIIGAFIAEWGFNLMTGTSLTRNLYEFFINRKR